MQKGADHERHELKMMQRLSRRQLADSLDSHMQHPRLCILKLHSTEHLIKVQLISQQACSLSLYKFTPTRLTWTDCRFCLKSHAPQGLFSIDVMSCSAFMYSKHQRFVNLLLA